MGYLSTGNKIVDEVSKINFSGDIMPRIWRKTITKENGKPYALARDILSDFVYWYRASEIVNEKTLEITMKKKFRDDLLYKSYEQLCEEFGESKRVIRDALKRLEDLGVIKRLFRTVTCSNGMILNNVMYIELIPSVLMELTYPSENPSEKKNVEESTENGEPLPPSDENVTRVVTNLSRRNTKNTTETIINNQNHINQCNKHSGYINAAEEEENRDGMNKREKLNVGDEYVKHQTELSNLPTVTPEQNAFVLNEQKKLRESFIETVTSQSEGEVYPVDFLKQWYDYKSLKIMVESTKLDRVDIDLAMTILHDTLNTTKKHIRVCGEDKPTSVVIGKLLNLTVDDIIYSLNQYHEQTSRIHNQRAYLLTIFYLAKEQSTLDIGNQVQHNMYGGIKNE